MRPPNNGNARAGELRAEADSQTLHKNTATNYRSLQGQIHCSGKAVIGDCPCCGYKNALSVTVKNGRRLYYCHAGCPQADLWAVVRGNQWNQGYVRPDKTPPADQKLQEYIRQLWQDSLPAKGSAVEIYLNARGISGDIPTSLRFLPRHRHSDTKTFWPLMLAAVTDHTGKLQAIHRTFITTGGKKAPVEPAKKTLAPVIGYAAHLGNAGERLVVTEGLETGLSVQQATGIAAASIHADCDAVCHQHTSERLAGELANLILQKAY